MPRSSFRRVARRIQRTVVLVIILSMKTSLSAIASGSGGPATGFSLPVSAGWNLICLPLDITDGVRESVFPTAVSNAFVFANGYEPVDTLRKGVGFWIKFAADETVAVDGITIDSNVIAVKAGWNLIGVLSHPVAASLISTQPDGIIASGFFGFSLPAGYASTDTLRPGVGYWVKFSGDGQLVLSGGGGGSCPASVEYEGRTYTTVMVGDQCWLGQNLNAGTMIFRASNAADNGVIEKYCYDGDTAKCGEYGGLYQWTEAMQYVTDEGVRGICPPGWHLPTYAEMLSLKTAVGSDGNSLKAVGQGTGEGAGTNTTGFAAMLSGYRSSDDTFYQGIGDNGFYWTSSVYDATNVSVMILYGYAPNINFAISTKFHGRSVRCIID